MGSSALAKSVALAILAVGGLAGGLYLAGGWSSSEPAAAPEEPPPVPAGLEPPKPHRFMLSELDVKDTSEAPDLATDPNGGVFLAWASKTGAAERSVFFTRSLDGSRTFETPKVVSKGGVYKSPGKGSGKSGGFERRALPHFAANKTGLHLSWSEAHPDGSGMRLVLATSTDAGVTFGSPRPAHTGDHANATFTAMAAGPNNAIACSWLDDRGGMQQPFAAIARDGKTFDPEKLVHPGQPGQGVCPCCPTGECFGPDGTLFVAYRNIKDGYRDVAVCRLKPGQGNFEGPFPVVSDAWKFDGCPHDGPSLAVIGDTLHVVWMDARTGAQRCYYARAKTSDMKFESCELHPGVPGTQGNAKLFADAAGGLHAVWEASIGAEPPSEGKHTGHPQAPKVGAGGGRAVRYAVIPSGQTAFSAPRAIDSKTGAFQTRPAITGNAKGELFVAWMELDTTGKAVVVTRLALSPEGAKP